MKGISVIIPVYNTEKYIEECLKSVLENEFRDFEIICVDDGSEDESLKKIQEWAARYECIKVISQENQGQSVARNKALEIAEGKYVYFLDSDDRITENALGELYQKLEEEELDVLYFSGQTFYDSEELEKQFAGEFEDSYLRKGNYDGCADGLTMLEQLREQKDYSVSPCIQILRREFLEEHHIRFIEGIVHEDNFFSFLVFVYAKKANCVNDVYFLRRIRDNSVMTSGKSCRHLSGYFTCFSRVFEYLDEHRIADEHEQVINELIRALRMNIQKTYLALDETERELFMASLSQKSRLFFRGILQFGAERERRLKAQIRKLKKNAFYKLEKACMRPFRAMKKVIKKVRRGKKDDKSICSNADL